MQLLGGRGLGGLGELARPGSPVSTHSAAGSTTGAALSATGAVASAATTIGDGRRRLATTAGTSAAWDVTAAALDDGVSDDAAHQTDRADRVVVARDDVVDVIGIGVGVDEADDRDVQTLGLVDRDVLALGVDDEDRAGKSTSCCARR